MAILGPFPTSSPATPQIQQSWCFLQSIVIGWMHAQQCLQSWAPAVFLGFIKNRKYLFLKNLFPLANFCILKAHPQSISLIKNTENINFYQWKNLKNTASAECPALQCLLLIREMSSLSWKLQRIFSPRPWWGKKWFCATPDDLLKKHDNWMTFRLKKQELLLSLERRPLWVN